MRVLIEGADLTGKSTLARNLTLAVRTLTQVSGTSRRVMRGKGPLNRGPAARRAELAYRIAQDPTSARITVQFAEAFCGDFDLADFGTPRIQETYVDHAIALAAVLGHRREAEFLRSIRPHLPDFDATVLLVADPDTRRARLLDREAPNAIDNWLVHEPERVAELDRRLAGLVGDRLNLLVLDTSDLDQVEVLTRALDHLRTTPMTFGIGQASTLSLRSKNPVS